MKLKSFRETNWRWATLGLSIVFFICNYYCYLLPATLATNIQKQLGIADDAMKYQLINSVYSFPNMIMPFFGGVFIDRIGMRIGIFLFASLLLIGQVIQAIAGYYGNYVLFLVGRTIFGLGGENMCITMSNFSKEGRGGEFISGPLLAQFGED